MRRMMWSALMALTGLGFGGSSSGAQQAKYYPLDVQDSSFVQVDLNGDGIPDFIEGHQSSGGPQELLSTGSGNYTTRNVSVPGNPVFALGSGDFNNDGKADVVFANPLGVAFGDGAGGFTTFQAVPGSSPNTFVAAQVADFTGDGRPDIAVLNATSSAFQIVLFANNGSGFDPGNVVYSQAVPDGSSFGVMYSTPWDLVLGDFDSDGHADLALRTTIADPVNPAQADVTLTALYGDGNGSFAAKTISYGNDTYEITAADLNNDGTSDILANTFTFGGAEPTVFYGQRDRSFTQASVPAGTDDRQINAMLADFDGDGRKDILYPAMNDASTNNIGVSALLQRSLGSFTLVGFYPIDTYNAQAGVVPFSQTFVGDYNHDGKPDVALIAGGNEMNHPSSLDMLLNPAPVPDGRCMAPQHAGIAVCSPASSGSVGSPVRFSFSATMFYPVRKMEVWIDGAKKSETYEVFGTEGFSDVSLSLPSGQHQVDLYSVGFDQTMLEHTSFSITVR